MKKILFYTDTPIHGGAERHMLLLAKNLSREQYQVQLACSKYEQLNGWCQEWKNEGLKVHRLNVIHKHDPRHAGQIKNILKTENPDLVHLHLWNPGSCRYAFSAVNKSQSKLIATEHDPFPLRGVKRTFKKNCLKKTDHTIAVSDANKKLLIELYPELKPQITTIHNGIDLKAFNHQLTKYHSQDRQKIRQNIFRANDNDFIILSIAALHPRKGLHYLLESFALLAATQQLIKLVIVGEGPQRKQLEKLIKTLHLNGRVTLARQQENIPHILKSSDLFVLPSVKEAFGLVLLEAMAAMLPIVASNVGGIPEIVEHKKNGILVDPRDTQALRQAMSDLIENKALREKMAYMGNHQVKKFDVVEMVRKTEQLYEKVLALR